MIKHSKTSRALVLAQKLRKSGLSHSGDEADRDISYIETLTNKEFSNAILSRFSDHKFANPVIQEAVCKFVTLNRPKEVEFSKRRVDVTVRLDECPSCGRKHVGYNVKIDHDNSLFVICGKTRSKVTITVTDDKDRLKEVRGFAMLKQVMAYKAEILTGSEEDINKICNPNKGN